MAGDSGQGSRGRVRALVLLAARRKGRYDVGILGVADEAQANVRCFESPGMPPGGSVGFLIPVGAAPRLSCSCR
jgi:hypothetical protein